MRYIKSGILDECLTPIITLNWIGFFFEVNDHQRSFEKTQIPRNNHLLFFLVEAPNDKRKPSTNPGENCTSRRVVGPRNCRKDKWLEAFKEDRS